MSGSVLYRFRAVYQKQDGECSITDTGIKWANEATSVDLPYAALEKHEVSPKGHTKALLKLTWVSKSQKPVVLTVLEANPQRAYATLCDARVTISTVVKAVKSSSAKTKREEGADDEPEAKRVKKDVMGSSEAAMRSGRVADGLAQRRRGLLASDARLAAAYRETVGAGALSEEDFWRARPGTSMFATAARRPDAADVNRPAPSNALLADVKPGAAEVATKDDITQGTTTLQYRLTKEKIAHIFAMYPAVRRAHAAQVPTKKLSEAAFWVKYFQSRYFMRDKGEAVSAGHVDEADDVFARYEDPADEFERKRAMAQRVAALPKSATFDLTKTAGERSLAEERRADEPPGLLQHQRHQEEENEYYYDETDPLAAQASFVVQKLNRHGDLVLHHEQHEAAPPRAAPEEADDALAELKAAQRPRYVEIDVTDRRAAAAADNDNDDDDDDDPSSAAPPVTPEWTPALLDPAVALARSTQVARAAFGLLDRKLAFGDLSAPVQPPPEPFRSETERRFGAASEILKHAHRFRRDRAADPSRAPEVDAKLDRLVERLRTLLADLDHQRDALKRTRDPDAAHHSAALKPLADQIGFAIAEHEEEQKNRGGPRRASSGGPWG